MLSCEESLMVYFKCYGMEMDFMIGCDEEGNLIVMKVVIYVDIGVYVFLGGLVL